MNKLNWSKTTCTLFLMCATTAITLSAQTFTTLFSFDNTDGQYPNGALIQATDGNLYGTAYEGGANSSGTVFQVTPNGTPTTLYNFCSKSRCADGVLPIAGLIQAADGNFYGTTTYGGGYACGIGNGCGTVFQITPSGTLTTLHSFAGPDGVTPAAALIQARDGNFYGTTSQGGANNACRYNCGTVFKITPSGTLTTLYSFCSQGGCTDGAYPNAALVQAGDGNFYGTTSGGGANNDGTVFQITPGGTLTTLHSFDGTDGEQPYAGLIQARDGNFYGTTAGNACAPSCGTVFKIAPSGTLTTLYSFAGYLTGDGSTPYATLIQATNGNFYGTTFDGGASNNCLGHPGCGVIFEITPAGTLTTLLSFDNTDGGNPAVGLVEYTDGTFYGTTATGGGSSACNQVGYEGCGTVFSLSVGLAPFVETQPTHGPVGRPVKILGTNLAGATSVTFDGTAAVFKVFSDSLIGATVPAGAATGTVQVTTPSRTLSSNVPFRVQP